MKKKLSWLLSLTMILVFTAVPPAMADGSAAVMELPGDALTLTEDAVESDDISGGEAVDAPESSWDDISEPEIPQMEEIAIDEEKDADSVANALETAPSSVNQYSTELQLTEYFSKKIRTALLNGSTEISLEGLNINRNNVKYFARLNWYCPYVDNYAINVSLYYHVNDGMYSYIKIDNQMCLKNTKVWVAGIDEKLKELTDMISDSSLSVADQALILHDYMTSHYSYDLSYSYYAPSDLLMRDKGVCNAYAYLFQYIMNQKGVECYTTVSTDMNHAWNIIKINGKYYHVDATWDDPTNDRYGLSGHNYFLVSDTTIKDGSHNHYGWDLTELKCSDTSYESAYFVSATSPVVIHNGYRYYIDANGLQRIDSYGNRTLLDDMGKWYVWGSGSTYYTKKYSGLFKYGDNLYYNTAGQVRWYNLSSGSISGSTQNTSNGYIYGCVEKYGRIMLSFEQTPGALEETEKVYTPLELPEICSSHSYGNGVVVTYADCLKQGQKVYRCKKCHKFKINSYAANGHSYMRTILKYGGIGTAGSCSYQCSQCGNSYTKSTPAVKTVKISVTSKVYSGSVVTPTLTVKDSAGNSLKKGTDYSVSIPSGRKNVGKYNYTVRFKGRYSGSKTLTLTIKPKTTSISSLSGASRAFTAKWKKQTAQTSGYQVKYSTKSSMASAKTVTVKGNTVVKKKVTGLKSGKKYYVQVRTYKSVNGTKIYSSWSDKKSVKAK